MTDINDSYQSSRNPVQCLESPVNDGGVGIPQSVFGISLPRNGRTDTAAHALNR
jgi:hypothetical protein